MGQSIGKYGELSLSDKCSYVQLLGRREKNKSVFDQWQFWDDVFTKLNEKVFAKFNPNDLATAEKSPEDKPEHWGIITTFRLPNHASVEYWKRQEGGVGVQYWKRGNSEGRPAESIQVSKDGKIDFWDRHLYDADGNLRHYAQTTFTEHFGNRSHILDLDGKTPKLDRLLFEEDEITIQLFRRAPSYTGGVGYTLKRGERKNALVSEIYFARPLMDVENYHNVFVNHRTLERCDKPESESSPVDSSGPIGFTEHPVGSIRRGSIYLLAAGKDKVKFHFPELPDEEISFPLELNVEEFLRDYRQRLFERL